MRFRNLLFILIITFILGMTSNAFAADLVSGVKVRNEPISLTNNQYSCTTTAKYFSFTFEVTDKATVSVTSNPSTEVHENHYDDAHWNYGNIIVNDVTTYTITVLSEDKSNSSTYNITVTQVAPSEKPTLNASYQISESAISVGASTSEPFEVDIVEIRVSGETEWTSYTDPESISVTPGTTYEARAKVKNRIGESPWSDISTLGPYQTYVAPEIVNLQSSKNGNSYTFTWECTGTNDRSFYVGGIMTNLNGSTNDVSGGFVQIGSEVYTIDVLPGCSLTFMVTLGIFSDPTTKKITITNTDSVDPNIGPSSAPIISVDGFVDQSDEYYIVSCTSTIDDYDIVYEVDVTTNTFQNNVWADVPSQYYTEDGTGVKLPSIYRANGKNKNAFNVRAYFKNSVGNGPYSVIHQSYSYYVGVYNLKCSRSGDNYIFTWNNPSEITSFDLKWYYVGDDYSRETTTSNSKVIAIKPGQMLEFRVDVDKDVHPSVDDGKSYSIQNEDQIPTVTPTPTVTPNPTPTPTPTPTLTPKPTTTPSSGSGSSGSSVLSGSYDDTNDLLGGLKEKPEKSPIPSSLPERKDKSPRGELNIEVKGGNLTILVDDELIEEAINQSGGTSGNNPKTVTLPKVDNMGDDLESKINLGIQSVKQLSEKNVAVKTSVGNVSVSINPTVLSQVSRVEGVKSVSLVTKKVDAEDQGAFSVYDGEGKIISTPYQFDIMINKNDGTEEKLTQFDELINIEIVLSAEEVEKFKANPNMKMCYMNYKTGLLEPLETYFDETTSTLTFFTSHFSKFVLVEFADVTPLYQKWLILSASLFAVLVILVISSVFIFRKNMFM